MIAIKLAYRNLAGAGLRTWLNAIVLSFSFVVIVWHKGLLAGWDRQARRDTIDWEIGGGQYWHSRYDPYDPFTMADAHGPVPEQFRVRLAVGSVTPILISQATLYVKGRMRSILIKGIDPAQKILSLPSGPLANREAEIPAMVGTRFARRNGLQEGERVTVRWRDRHGTFDAAEARVVGIFKTNVPAIDNGQIWVPLDALREMLQMPEEATIVVTAQDAPDAISVQGWVFRDHAWLLAELDEIIRSKSVGGAVMYVLLMSLAMLAIFDTQVLSVFRRQREIGTDMALGMTRGQVVRLFTIEGAMHSVLAAALAAAYGVPLLGWQAARGFSMPQAVDDYGLAIAEKIIPVYSAGLILGTTALVTISATVVSFIPARRIARMKPTDAIRGKIQ